MSRVGSLARNGCVLTCSGVIHRNLKLQTYLLPLSQQSAVVLGGNWVLIVHVLECLDSFSILLRCLLVPLVPKCHSSCVQISAKAQTRQILLMN